MTSVTVVHFKVMQSGDSTKTDIVELIASLSLAFQPECRIKNLKKAQRYHSVASRL